MTRQIDLDRETEKEAEAEAWHMQQTTLRAQIKAQELANVLFDLQDGLTPAEFERLMKRLAFARWLVATGRLNNN